MKKIRQAWPDVRIVIRGDSGFCREPIMRWCEENNVDFLFGLAKNKRLTKVIGKELHEAREQFHATKKAARVFKDFEYRTRRSWSRSRRVVGKAEHLWKGANPRIIVTTLPIDRFDARTLYEDQYCARGDMENRIKEQQLFLFADRTSTHAMRSNQLRLLFSTIAYVLYKVLKEFGTKGTPLASAQVDTIRIQLLKIGAKIRVSVRRIHLSLTEAYPSREVFEAVLHHLRHPHPPPLGTE